jgi:hypothetical protein
MKTILHSPLPCRIPPFFPAALMLALIGFGNLAEAVSIRFLPINEEVSARKIGLQDGKGLTELNDLNPKKRSKAYVCTPGDVPATLVALDRERPGGNPLSVDIVLPAGIESPLVLILADTEHRSGIRVLVLEDAVTSFPWGCPALRQYGAEAVDDPLRQGNHRHRGIARQHRSHAWRRGAQHRRADIIPRRNPMRCFTPRSGNTIQTCAS